jgi:hypothetical protein
VISSWVRPFDSRKESRFARGEDWTFGSERKVSAETTRSSRIGIVERGGGGSAWAEEVDGMERRKRSRFKKCHVKISLRKCGDLIFGSEDSRKYVSAF